jgi:hypothetical protein
MFQIHVNAQDLEASIFEKFHTLKVLLGVISPKDTFIIDYSPKRLKHHNISSSSTMMAFTYPFG